MNKLIPVILIITFAHFNLFSQTKNFLISVSLQSNNNKEIEKLHLPVYYQFENSLITKTDDKKLIKLKSLSINYQVLSELNSSDDLFIVTSKKGIIFPEVLSNENVLVKRNNTAIIKNPVKSIKEYLNNNLKIVKLKSSGNFYKDIKTVNKNSNILGIDSVIANIVNLINADSVEYFIQSLQDMGTRYYDAANTHEVSGWIMNEFYRLGFTEVEYDTFYYGQHWQRNVVATLPGTIRPDEIYVVGGHHDDYSNNNPLIYAPGADDNASGTSAVLEIARVLMESGYQPESTIKFITFAAEEAGLHGSDNYAQYAFNNGMNIQLMINHDMISNTNSTLQNSSVDINWYGGYEAQRDFALQSVESYSILEGRIGSLNSSGSDSYEFWQRGYPAIYFEESQFSPYYHSDNDVITNYSMEYCAEVIKSSCGTLLSIMVSPSGVDDFNLVDLGDGTSIRATWSPNIEPDLDGYKIYVGNNSGDYFNSFFTVQTYFDVTDLEEANEYFIGISAIDNEGNESFITERSLIPYSIPRAPANLNDEPNFNQINLTWNSNHEFDLLGYNIYRSETFDGNYTKLNNEAFSDTIFVDDNAQNNVYYYYQVKAVDSLLNESIDNEIVRSKVISMDNGILVVDETSDGDGSLFDPTDEEVDQFFASLLSDFSFSNYDVIEEGDIKLADLGAFSTILWHGNDLNNLTTLRTHIEDVQKYLDFGGNFFYCGYKPAFVLSGIQSYPIVFNSGDFIYDYLKIDNADLKFGSKFIGAISLESGYPDIFVDTTKTSPNTNYHLSQIESISPNSEGLPIYSYETYYDSTTAQGSMKGMNVGAEYIGVDYKTVVVSFPLYYMEQNEAAVLVNNILENKFGEVTSIDEDEKTIVVEYKLEQNYPNPFNPITNINFSIVESGFVTLKVYDILGREVKTLIRENMNPGYHSVKFNAEDLSSGIYLYRLEAGNFVQTKKLILLK